MYFFYSYDHYHTSYCASIGLLDYSFCSYNKSYSPQLLRFRNKLCSISTYNSSNSKYYQGSQSSLNTTQSLGVADVASIDIDIDMDIEIDIDMDADQQDISLNVLRYL